MISHTIWASIYVWSGLFTSTHCSRFVSLGYPYFPYPYPLSANITKRSNTFKQFVANLPTNCLSVFDHFVGLALKGLITAVYFKDHNRVFKIVYCIRCSVVCKIVFCSEFPDIPDNTGKVTRRRAQAIAKRYAFHANAINMILLNFKKLIWVLQNMDVNFFKISFEGIAIISKKCLKNTPCKNDIPNPFWSSEF